FLPKDQRSPRGVLVRFRALGGRGPSRQSRYDTGGWSSRFLQHQSPAIKAAAGGSAWRIRLGETSRLIGGRASGPVKCAGRDVLALTVQAIQPGFDAKTMGLQPF